jgi:hypothetical protein
VRRDFGDAGRAFAEREPWALEWKERIGTLYHLNALRLKHWNPERPLSEQSPAFYQYHEALKDTLPLLHDETSRGVAPDSVGARSGHLAEGENPALSKSAQTKQKEVFESLLEHGPGLTVFVEHPQPPWITNKVRSREERAAI